MDTDSYIQLITIIILLFLSAFFSSAETSFMTVSKMKIRSLMDEGNKRAALVAKIIDDSGKLLSADRKSTRLNSSHRLESRMPSSA